MGPPLISGGNRNRLMATPNAQHCFNGAAADQRRKLGDTAQVITALDVASMGPPLISGGNRAAGHFEMPSE